MSNTARRVLELFQQPPKRDGNRRNRRNKADCNAPKVQSLRLLRLLRLKSRIPLMKATRV